MSKRKKAPIYPPICPYCERKGVLCTGADIYRNRPDLHHKWMYRCDACRDVYVGCHDGTQRALGTLANRDTRKAREATHAIFDPLWQGFRHGDRDDAYEWLARELGMEPRYVHIAMADIHLCRRIYELCLLAGNTKNFKFSMELT